LSLTVLRDNNWDVWIFDLARTVATRFTFDEGYEADQVRSPDGQWIAYASNKGGPVSIYRKRVDGSGEAELLAALPGRTDWYPQSWSSDGRFILATAATNANDIFVLPLDEGAKPEPYVATPFTEEYPDFSPDVRFVAYDSNESGRLEVYVRTFPKGEGKWQVSDGGGAQPRWSADGRHLFYRTGEGIDVVDVESAGGSFRAGRIRNLFKGNFHGGIQGNHRRRLRFPGLRAGARRKPLRHDEGRERKAAHRELGDARHRMVPGARRARPGSLKRPTSRLLRFEKDGEVERGIL
jgi:Tol biopolymer transport system component